MENNKDLHSVAFVQVAFILFLIFLLLTVSVATAQSASSMGPYAYITNYGGNTISVINTTTNTNVATVAVGDGPYGVAVSPDGLTVYVTNERYPGTVSVIDTVTNTETATVPVGSYPSGIAVTPDGKKVYVTGNQHFGDVYVIDTVTNTVTAIVPVGSDPSGIAVTLDGSKAYVVNMESSNVSVIDTVMDTVTATVPVGNSPYGVAVSPDGKYLYVTISSNATVSVINTSTNTVVANVDVGADPHEVAVSPDGSRVYVTKFSGSANALCVINTLNNNVTATITVGVGPRGVAVTPDGGKVYVTNTGSNTVSVIDTSTNKITDTVNVGVRPIALGQFIGPMLAPPVLPVANFSANVTSGYAPLSVQFTDLSKNVTKWKWFFGDGTNSTVQNPVHKYSKAGNYTVSLTASNSAGNNTKTRTNYIKVKPFIKPVAKFTSNVTSGRAPLTVAFTDKSTNNPTSWKWTFGDGTNSTLKNSTHRYLLQGNYTVKLIVANAAGSNSTTKINYIKVTPTNTRPGL